MAIGQDNHCPWIERDLGMEFDKWDCPVLDEVTLQSTHPKVFFGGDSAFGPENIIWASAHAHQAAISIHLLCEGKDLKLSLIHISEPTRRTIPSRMPSSA